MPISDPKDTDDNGNDISIDFMIDDHMDWFVK